MRIRRRQVDQRSSWPFPAGAALITGASSGIGEGFARALARRGMSLLLVALPQDEERLSSLAAELSTQHQIRIEIVPIDLTELDAPQRLQSAADELEFEPDLLINNAGVGILGRFSDLPLEGQLAMIRLNVEALVALTGLYLPRMLKRGHGAILNVASTAAFDPFPYMAVYAASKAFVLRFSEALWAENHRHGVRVVAICPGPASDTHFGGADNASVTGGQRFQPQIPRDAIVTRALDAIERDQPVTVHRVAGMRVVYYVTSLAGAVGPRRWKLRLAERLARWYFRLP